MLGSQTEGPGIEAVLSFKVAGGQDKRLNMHEASGGARDEVMGSGKGRGGKKASEPPAPLLWCYGRV
ncbi:hypothetical protein GCM10008955_25520 [Deinococcus malanensis]|uniref:Uncharacterized protein n=1 Tax=Deinococcus malanensis TaxID=1706855 RepID=A0ABQ2EXF8_9DEIO|nr:hypothetical protein GCM10008955_25520 [Deinococcus malanensis]